jgi:hypothetical protein
VDNSSLPVCDVPRIVGVIFVFISLSLILKQKQESNGLPLKYRYLKDNLSKVKPASGFLDAIVAAEADAEKPFIPPVLCQSIMPLTDYMSGNLDMMYFGSMNFGTPPQPLAVDVDTGSADLWIPVDCDGCTNKQFENTRSSTCQNSDEPFSVSYVRYYFVANFLF